MALEWWGCRDDAHAVPCRLPSCGHLVELNSSAQSPAACSVCGDLASMKRGFVGRDYVPSADLTWPGVTCSAERRLRCKGQLLSGARVASIEDLVAAVSAPKAHRLHLRVFPLCARSEPPAPCSFLVWRATTAGCEVYGGTVELPEASVLLLAGRGAHFYSTTFTGGVIMCAGSHYSGTFHDCTFTATAFYAVHGAAVTLRRCTIKRAHIALTLSGGATHATLINSTLRGCHSSVVVDAGASVRARDCTLWKTDFAVVVTGQGSHAALERCAVRGGGPGGIGETGVAVHLGSASLGDCLLTHFNTPVRGRGGTAEMHGVVVADSACCIAMTRRAWGLVRECDLSLTPTSRADPIAIAATRSGGSEGRACVQVERTEVRQALPKSRALSVDGGGSLSATLCHFDTSSGVAVVGEDEGGGRAALLHCTGTSPSTCLAVHSPAATLRVVGGRYSGGSMVCGAFHGGKLTAVDCEFCAGGVLRYAGVVHVDSARAWLRGCCMHDGVVGVLATASEVVVTGTTMRDFWRVVPSTPRHIADVMGGCGVTFVGGHMAVRGCHVQRCAVGVEAQGEEGDAGCLTLEDTHFEDCASGACCDHPSAAKVSRCTFRGLKGPRQQASPDLAALRAAALRMFKERGDAGAALQCLHASVQDCSFEGFTAAIQVSAGGAEVPVVRCVLRATSPRGVGVLAHGKIAVEDCEFHGVEGLRTHGLVAQEAAVAAVRRCSFSNATAAAVLCEGGSSATVVDSRMSGSCDHALVVRDTAHLAAQDCSVSGAQVGLHVKASGGTLSAKRVTLHTTLENVRIDTTPGAPWKGSSRTSVKLVESSLSGAYVGVAVLEAAVDLAVLRCQISARGDAVYLSGPVVARIKGGRMHDCRYGAIVGLSTAGLPGACAVCGMDGVDARTAAIRAGLVAGRGGELAAPVPCTHLGAIARLRMADCELERCSAAGVRVNLNGRFEGEGVTARDCNSGFRMVYQHFRSSFVGCRAIGCAVGAQALQMTSAIVDLERMDEPIPEVEVLRGDRG